MDMSPPRALLRSVRSIRIARELGGAREGWAQREKGGRNVRGLGGARGSWAECERAGRSTRKLGGVREGWAGARERWAECERAGRSAKEHKYTNNTDRLDRPTEQRKKNLLHSATEIHQYISHSEVPED